MPFISLVMMSHGRFAKGWALCLAVLVGAAPQLWCCCGPGGSAQAATRAGAAERCCQRPAEGGRHCPPGQSDGPGCPCDHDGIDRAVAGLLGGAWAWNGRTCGDYQIVAWTPPRPTSLLPAGPADPPLCSLTAAMLRDGRSLHAQSCLWLI
jgi:hypothetical protein